ncbi:MAG TPA: S8 family serine peptidase [Candidatus Limnocylindrales bacterium]|nr:S8 family serine peptidase [Candidatus Limnocylindrales bacterium]
MIPKIKSTFKNINFSSPKTIFIIFIILVPLLLIIIKPQIRQDAIVPDNNSSIPKPTPELISGRDYARGQITVKFNDGVPDAEINKLLEKYSSRIRSTITGINVKVISVPVGEEDNVRKELSKEEIVKYVEFDYIGHVLYTPNDPDFGIQWAHKNTGQDIKGKTGTANADVKIEQAWDIAKGAGVTVAVIDTGIDLDHPEFAGKVIEQKVFIENSFTNNRHGTHVAGIVSANTNNGEGVAGACPECKLLSAKLDAENANDIEVSDETDAVIWAADKGAKVISMSIGDPFNSKSFGEAVAYAWNKGAVIVASAGNCGDSNYRSNYCTEMNQIFYPASYPNVVSVAATDNRDVRASFSTHGTWVDIAAPGEDIYSTLPSANGSYGYLSGTSMAAPLVSGIAALIWSSPYGTSNQAVVDRLLKTADKIEGTGSSWQNGRVNAASAVGNSLPKGVVDEISCNKIGGWAFDPDESGKSIEVHVYIDGENGDPNAKGHDLGTTPVDRPDVNKAYEITGKHGFDWPLPAKYLDGKSHDIYVYAINTQTGINPEIGRKNTGICQEQTNPAPTSNPQVTQALPDPTATTGPAQPVPTFVCGGSPNSICATPTLGPTIGPRTPAPTFAQPIMTEFPKITPPVNQDPKDHCLDPRSTPERIREWVGGFLKKINNYIQGILGNPQDPNRPPPPQPCIMQ